MTVNPHSVTDLGGRIPLMAPDEMSPGQRRLHERLMTSYVASARSAGYRAALDDGRVIGPFNGFLRVPQISGLLLDWVDAVSAAGLPLDVREVVILTVAAESRTEFPVYAHEITARAAGVAAQTVEAIVRRLPPPRLSAQQRVAHELALALVRDHQVPDQLYTDAISQFGLENTLAYVMLIGQYLTISAVVTCLRVPAPE